MRLHDLEALARRVGSTGRARSSTRSCTCANCVHETYGADGEQHARRARGTAARSVATQSITTNSAKNSSDEPRSFSAIMTTSETPHARSDRAEVLRLGQIGTARRGHVAIAEQLALLDEVRGEEDGQHDLGELAGLEVERAEARPRSGRR